MGSVISDVATIARPETILGRYRKLIARKFDGSKARRGPGRPRIKREVEQLIIRRASENRDWGYDRIAGALANLLSLEQGIFGHEQERCPCSKICSAWEAGDRRWRVAILCQANRVSGAAAT